MNRLLFCIIAFAIFQVNTSCAQNLIWSKKVPDEQFGKAFLDHQGNKYVFASQGQSTHIYKFDADSNIIWKKTISDVWGGHALYDGQHNMYYVGIAYKNLLSGAKIIDFNPGPTQDTVKVDQGFQFIAKYDSSGSFQWVKVLRNNNFYLGEVSMDLQCNVYISGSFSGTINLDPNFNAVSLSTSISNNGFLAKYDSSGKILWAKDGKSLGRAKADIAGNIYAINGFMDSLDIAPGTAVNMIYSVDINNVCIIKYDQQCNVVWNKVYGSRQYMHAQGFDMDLGGNIYVSGEFMDSADFEPGPGVTMLREPHLQGHAIYILKLDANGTFAWAKCINGIVNGAFTGCRVNGMSGEIYILGTFGGNIVDFDPGMPIINKQPESITSFDFFLAKYNKNGNFQWVIHTPGGGFGDFLDLGNAIYCFGGSLDSTDLDPMVSNRHMAYIPAYQKPIGYMAKYSVPLVVENMDVNTIEVLVHPNPVATNELFIDLGKKYKTVSLRLIDITGKLVHTGMELQTSKFKLNIDSIKPGMYLLQLNTPEGYAVVKLIRN